MICTGEGDEVVVAVTAHGHVRFDNLPSVPALFRLLKGIALLPYTSPIVDTVLDALALSLSQQEDYLRGQLQPKQINFLLYALTNDSRCRAVERKRVYVRRSGKWYVDGP